MKIKKRDRISMFNQLTSSELADCSLFTDIIDHHYEKFQYFYNIFSNVDQSLISNITCNGGESYIKVSITPHENNNINQIIYDINNSKHNYRLWEYFNINISECGGVLEIVISMNDDIEEGDMYGDKFI